MKKLLNLVMVVGLLGGCTSITANENSTQPIGTNETSSITANNNSAQPIGTNETSSIPPMSSFAIEACNIAFALTECKTFALQRHWGEVKDIKIFKISDIKQIPGNKDIQIYVKSQGCLGYHDSPQKEAWYPAQLPNIPLEGKTVTAKLVNNTMMSPKLREDFVGLFGISASVVLDHCNPVEIKS